MNSTSPLALAFCGVLLAVPLHYVVASHALPQMQRFFSDPVLAAAVLFSGAFSTGIAYALWNFGVKILGTSHAAVFQNLVPFFALLAGWPLLGEIPVWLQIAGGLIIVTGLVIMRRNRS